jgi:hypothetical protein
MEYRLVLYTGPEIVYCPYLKYTPLGDLVGTLFMVGPWRMAVLCAN